MSIAVRSYQYYVLRCVRLWDASEAKRDAMREEAAQEAAHEAFGRWAGLTTTPDLKRAQEASDERVERREGRNNGR